MNQRILVIDDDYLNSELLIELLEMNGFEVESALTGAEGLRLARDMQPDIILVDLLMSPINGFDVIELLARDVDTACIPVVIISALTDPANIRRAIELGAVEFLRKPYEQDLLLDVLRQQMKV